MSNIYAGTPANRWSIKIPAAAYGAQQLPVPQPATMGELETEGFRLKLVDAVRAQNEANSDAFAAMKAREGAQPYQPKAAHRPAPGAMAASPPHGTAPDRIATPRPGASAFDRDMEAGAAAARAAMTGDPLPAGERSQRPNPGFDTVAEERGAGAARDLIAIAGQPSSHRQDLPGAATGADAAAGAAEARRLLGI